MVISSHNAIFVSGFLQSQNVPQQQSHQQQPPLNQPPNMPPQQMPHQINTQQPPPGMRPFIQQPIIQQGPPPGFNQQNGPMPFPQNQLWVSNACCRYACVGTVIMQ